MRMCTGMRVHENPRASARAFLCDLHSNARSCVFHSSRRRTPNCRRFNSTWSLSCTLRAHEISVFGCCTGSRSPGITASNMSNLGPSSRQPSESKCPKASLGGRSQQSIGAPKGKRGGREMFALAILGQVSYTHRCTRQRHECADMQTHGVRARGIVHRDPSVSGRGALVCFVALRLRARPALTRNTHEESRTHAPCTQGMWS